MCCSVICSVLTFVAESFVTCVPRFDDVGVRAWEGAYVYTIACTCIYKRVYISTYICISTYMYTCLFVFYIHIYMCICTYVYVESLQ